MAEIDINLLESQISEVLKEVDVSRRAIKSWKEEEKDWHVDRRRLIAVLEAARNLLLANEKLEDAYQIDSGATVDDFSDLERAFNQSIIQLNDAVNAYDSDGA